MRMNFCKFAAEKWQSGRIGGLENRCTAMYHGESIFLRNKSQKYGH